MDDAPDRRHWKESLEFKLGWRSGSPMIEPESSYGALMRRIEAREATIGVIGLGYVGLPLALACLDAGFRVIGFDNSAERVAAIRRADQVIGYISAEVMQTAAASGRLDVTSDLGRLSEPDP